MVKFTDEELDMLRGIIRFYQQEQSFPRDHKLWGEVQDLYDKVSSLVPNQLLGELRPYA